MRAQLTDKPCRSKPAGSLAQHAGVTRLLLLLAAALTHAFLAGFLHSVPPVSCRGPTGPVSFSLLVIFIFSLCLSFEARRLSFSFYHPREAFVLLFCRDPPGISVTRYTSCHSSPSLVLFRCASPCINLAALSSQFYSKTPRDITGCGEHSYVWTGKELGIYKIK